MSNPFSFSDPDDWGNSINVAFLILALLLAAAVAFGWWLHPDSNRPVTIQLDDEERIMILYSPNCEAIVDQVRELQGEE